VEEVAKIALVVGDDLEKIKAAPFPAPAAPWPTK